MGKLQDLFDQAEMSPDDFAALHPRPFLLPLGYTGSERLPHKRGARKTVGFAPSSRPVMGTHPLAGEVFELLPRKGSGRVAVGRSPANDVCIVLEESISDRHCVFHLDGDTVRLEDLGSTNGTYLGERRLEPHVPAVVEDEAMITLGRYNFAFLLPRSFQLTLQMLRAMPR